MALCSLCLSTDRNTSLVNCAEAFRIVAGYVENERTRVCWECRARLRHVDQFREQAQRATLQLSLTATSQLTCLSRLGCSTKTCYDADWPVGQDEEDKPPLPLLLDVDETKQSVDLQLKPEPEEMYEDWIDNSEIAFDAPIVEESVDIPPQCKKKKRKEKTKVVSEDSIVKEEIAPVVDSKRKGLKKTSKVKQKTEEAEDVNDLEEMEFDTFDNLEEDLALVCSCVRESREDVVRSRLARLRGARLAGARHACRSCALAFRSPELLRRHVDLLHCEDGLACGVCDCRAVDEATLLRHAASHVGLKCARCRFRTRNRDSMRRHARLHDRDSTTTFPCDICGKQFKSKQYFSFHRAAHVSDKRFECDHCGRVYSTRVQIFRHLKHHRKTFLCDVCGKAFSNKTTLKCHSLAHLGAEQRQFECALCHRRYVNKFKLEVHMRFHSGEKPYTCEVCSASFREKAQLAAHTRKMHPEQAEPMQKRKKITERTKSAFVNKPYVETRPEDGERKRKAQRPRERKEYECNVCGKKLKDRWRLKFHLAAHSNERPYKCDECDLTFKYPQGVWTHKLIHQGGKQHQCTICGSQFTQKGNLTSHMKIHNNERPHACAVCGNKFRAKRDLRKHVYLRHGSADCDQTFADKQEYIEPANM